MWLCKVKRSNHVKVYPGRGLVVLGDEETQRRILEHLGGHEVNGFPIEVVPFLQAPARSNRVILQF